MSTEQAVLTVTPFEPTGPLPTGTTVLEASAGTGKTYAIVGLMVRYVAEGVATLADQLLITFSRQATHELRERARARLVTVESALRDPGKAASDPDEVVRYLAAGDPAEVRARHRRLRDALSDFDSATITTTHGFCQRMLDAIGLAGDYEPDAVMVEDVDDLVTETVQDLYLAQYAGTATPPFGLDDAQRYGSAAVRNPRAVITPTGAAEGSAAGERVRYAGGVRAEVARRKRRGRLRDFDDLQNLLAAALADEENGAAARDRMRSMFSVVLVDEFQDTDPVQWQVLKAAFHGHRTLVLVGDPKQAIYAFRGAEVYSYLDAVGHADRHQVLTVNWRSDRGLVRALYGLYGEVALGDEKIVVGDVDARHAGPRLSDGPPLRLRYLGRNGTGPKTRYGVPRVPGVRAAVLHDVAADIAATLAAGPLLDTDADIGRDPASDVTERALEPGDIAVLVRRNDQVAALQAELGALGVPAVASGGASVFTTAAAVDWLRVLQAMENPGRGDRARLAALTPLFGVTARELDERGDELVARISGRLRSLVAVLTTAGFAAMFDQLAAETDFDHRLLSRVGGERAMTDLRHVAELIQHATVTLGLGLAATTRWLTERIVDPGLGGTADPSRRLATDTAAVQLMTVHAAKGLEFPVVYLPFGWDGGGFGDKRVFTFHDPDGARMLDVGGETDPGHAERFATAQHEAAGEELRLFYVGATRARCRLVLWWAPSTTTGYSPLHRMLFGERAGGRVPPDRVNVPADDKVPALLAQWAAPLGDRVGLEPVDAVHPVEPPHYRGPDTSFPALELAEAHRTVDTGWRRTSYSALIAGAGHGPAEPDPRAASEPEVPDRGDEPTEEPTAAAATVPDDGARPSLMNGLSGGALFGTLVHEILEHVDTDAPDLAAEVLARCREAVEFDGAPDAPETLADALVGVLNTPLGLTGPGGEAITLGGVAARDRLSELEFELPLADAGPTRPASTRPAPSGSTGGGRAIAPAQLAELLREHLPADDPLAGYADRLAAVPGEALRGYLTGSIDSVLRLPDTAGTGAAYVIVDYKTNRLARGDLSTADYTPAAMAREMIDSHYVLQALLYSVALHRFLRWRLPDYDPGRHLGPVQYHFVRGMIGPDTPPGCGVFEWHPPTALILAVSAALSGGGDR